MPYSLLGQSLPLDVLLRPVSFVLYAMGALRCSVCPVIINILGRHTS